MSTCPILETITVGALEVNCYIFGCREHKKAIVIDPGDNAGEINSKLEMLELQPVLIINTHAHADHVGGNLRLKTLHNIPIYIHEDGSKYLTAPESKDLAAFYGVKPSPAPDHLLKEGDVIPVCSHFSLKVIHTPGHSPGGICLHYNNTLFCGDTLFANSVGRSDLPGGSHETLIKSIKEKLLILEDETVIFPGHGPKSTIKNEKRFNPFLR